MGQYVYNCRLCKYAEISLSSVLLSSFLIRYGGKKKKSLLPTAQGSGSQALRYEGLRNGSLLQRTALSLFDHLGIRQDVHFYPTVGRTSGLRTIVGNGFMTATTFGRHARCIHTL